MAEETRNQTLSGRGRDAYSTLGSAIAGQAVAAAAGMSYPDLMRTRLFEPLGMSHTAIQVGHALVAGGNRRPDSAPSHGSWTPTPPAAPRSPPPATLRNSPPHSSTGPLPAWPPSSPRPPPPRRNTRVGDFWQISTWQTGQTITHHAGQTGGYASYLGLDRPGHKAVIVLSDVANDASDLGTQLLAYRS